LDHSQAPDPVDGRDNVSVELGMLVEGGGEPVVLVHGFTQTLASWDRVAVNLGRDRKVIRVDAPGHGTSAAVHVDLAQGARLLGESGGRATYVGYSMGGRLALRLALDQPQLVRALVLLGATAGIDDPIERRERRAHDEALAQRLEAEGVEDFVDGWMNQAMFEAVPRDGSDRAGRMTNSVDGLASSLRLAGTGTMDPPWWDELDRLDMDTLVLAGEHDQKFTGLGLRLAETIGPSAHFATIEGAHHAAHLEQPEAFVEVLRDFLAIQSGSDPEVEA